MSRSVIKQTTCKEVGTEYKSDKNVSNRNHCCRGLSLFPSAHACILCVCWSVVKPHTQHRGVHEVLLREGRPPAWVVFRTTHCSCVHWSVDLCLFIGLCGFHKHTPATWTYGYSADSLELNCCWIQPASTLMFLIHFCGDLCIKPNRLMQILERHYIVSH